MYAELIDQGYAALRRADPEAALRRFQQASEANPERPQAYFAMAVAYLEMGNMNDNAFQALKTALDIDPDYVPARAYLGIELLKRYDIHGAQEELDRALQDGPTNLLVHIKYAEYYYRMGFYPSAVKILEKGLKTPHGAHEQMVTMARELLTQARQKCKGIIIREPPDPRDLFRFFARFRSILRTPRTRGVS
jgi:tetratricopeptide (TPR) repeat protein